MLETVELELRRVKGKGTFWTGIYNGYISWKDVFLQAAVTIQKQVMENREL